jgi:hypothetical protein
LFHGSALLFRGHGADGVSIPVYDLGQAVQPLVRNTVSQPSQMPGNVGVRLAVVVSGGNGNMVFL